MVLFFFPAGNIVTQVEATGMLTSNNLITTAYPVALGVLASAIGLGWSNATLAIAAYCGRKYGVDSEQSNAVIGVGLALLSLFGEFSAWVMANKLKLNLGGFVRSSQPRLTAASRIALFFPIFLLTGNTGVVSVSPLSAAVGEDDT